MIYGMKINFSLFFKAVTSIIVFSFCSPIFADTTIVSDNQLSQTEQQGGVIAKQRLLQWQSLINHHQNGSELVKLKLVNQFFNRMKYVPSKDKWDERTHWATPIELLSQGRGSCEDFALAKYYSLRKMGIAAEKLRLAYVKALPSNQACMILAYYRSSTADPIILGHSHSALFTASKRPDLKPLYSFNETKNQQLNLWQDWTMRLSKQGLQ